MTHLAEERNIAAPPEVIWGVVADTKRWPQFFATPKERGKLTSVEYLEEAITDALDVKRRFHFVGVPSWDEQVSRWRENESIAWLGIRNPWQKYWQQQMELVPGRGFTTLRWDIFYKLSAPRPITRVYKHWMENMMISSLQRIERLALQDVDLKRR